MKCIYLGLILVFIGLSSYSQSQAKDIIYPADQGKIIINCSIIKITEGNLVFYKLRQKEYQRRALTVKREGVYIDLSEFVTQPADSKQEIILKSDTLVSIDAQDTSAYHHYQALYKSAVNKRTAGLVFSSLGVVLSATSYLIAKESKNPKSILQGVFLFGFFSFNLGMPTLIANNIKANKNLKKMKAIEEQKKVELSMGITSNGLGLMLRF